MSARRQVLITPPFGVEAAAGGRDDGYAALLMQSIVSRPLVHHQLDLFARADVDSVVLRSGAGTEADQALRAYVGDGARWGIEVRWVPAPTPAQCRGVATLADGGSSLLPHAYIEAQLPTAELTLLWPASLLAAFDLAATCERERTNGETVSLICIGSRKARADVLMFVTDRRDVLDVQREDVSGVAEHVANAADASRANLDVLAGRFAGDAEQRRFGVIIPGRQVRPGVWLGYGARVARDARLEGPVVLGDHCHVRGGARLEHAVVGEGAVVDRAASVKRAVVPANCYVAAGRRVGEGLGDPAVTGEEPAAVRRFDGTRHGALALFWAAVIAPLALVLACLRRLVAPRRDEVARPPGGAARYMLARASSDESDRR